MTAIVAIASSLVGFAAIALSMTRHHGDLFGRAPTRRAVRGLRIVGWFSLAASLAGAIADSGTSVGIVLWFGIATVAALTVAMLLTYRRWWWRRT